MTEEKTYYDLIHEHPAFVGEDEGEDENAEFTVEVVDESTEITHVFFDHGFTGDMPSRDKKETVQFFCMYWCKPKDIYSPENTILKNICNDDVFHTVYFDENYFDPIEEALVNIIFDRLNDTTELQETLCSRLFDLNNEEDCRLIYETVVSYYELCGNVYRTLADYYD